MFWKFIDAKNGTVNGIIPIGDVLQNHLQIIEFSLHAIQLLFHECQFTPLCAVRGAFKIRVKHINAPQANGQKDGYFSNDEQDIVARCKWNFFHAQGLLIVSNFMKALCHR